MNGKPSAVRKRVSTRRFGVLGIFRTTHKVFVCYLLDAVCADGGWRGKSPNDGPGADLRFGAVALGSFPATHCYLPTLQNRRPSS